ncbi:FAD-binding protein [Cryobacterium frigoriphilum]|uniref:FAD-binding protein n=1 Tax=Cryobacterium frigoriphilum TaxID=1259150 RepID=A0A4V3IS03_9MICO|nr:FAD-dependent oxidoreductase [Cryobacterium frigoriphilum]TFD54474.1 FAD-binding protein [Cryobacterium frigoriphilum]
MSITTDAAPTTTLVTMPLQLGQVRLKNRLVSAPMERNYCDTEGHLSRQYKEYLLERARAGVGLVFTEATYVRADGKGRTHQLGAHDDSCIAPLADLTAAMHAEGALVGCELNHGGRTAQSRISGSPNLAPSAIPCAIAGGEVPKEMTEAEALELVEAYAAAARRCVRAGIDVLSIHGGHGYLVHQFMSPLYNHRTDAFADPVHFLNLVIEAVRAAAPGLAVGLRFSAVEGTPGGLDADATFAIISRARLSQLDFLDVSAGSYEAGEWIVQSGEWQPGFLREAAERYRVFGLPIGMAGRINSPEVVEDLLQAGAVDFVSLGRALHADPDFARAALEGGSYRPCIACNVCIDNLGDGQVGCTVNPGVGRGTVPVPLPRVRPGVSVLVAGAGPAGLTAARDLAIAGAAVTLVDPANDIGGQMALAATMQSTPDFHRFLDWSRAELQRLGVRVQLGSSVDEVLAAQRAGGHEPQGIIRATGGERPAVPHSGGSAAGAPMVVEVRDWLRRGEPTPQACTVWGADAVGMSVADTLASRGASVLLVGSETEIALESGRRAKILAVPRLRANPQVRIVLGATVTAIEADRLQVSVDGGAPQWLDAPGPVLVSHGVLQNGDLHTEDGVTPVATEAFAASKPAGSPSTIRFAIQSGTDAARRLGALLG